MGGPQKVAEPHKELRFTRSGQAQGFVVGASVAMAVFLLSLVVWVSGHPVVKWWMPWPFIVLALVLGRVALRCVRHAYVILTPLGVEVFPFFKPEKNLNLIYWSEIKGVDFDEHLDEMRLHHDEGKTSGVVLSLKPVLEGRRELLKRAVEGRVGVRS